MVARLWRFASVDLWSVVGVGEAAARVPNVAMTGMNLMLDRVQCKKKRLGMELKMVDG